METIGTQTDAVQIFAFEFIFDKVFLFGFSEFSTAINNFQDQEFIHTIVSIKIEHSFSSLISAAQCQFEPIFFYYTLKKILFLMLFILQENGELVKERNHLSPLKPYYFLQNKNSGLCGLDVPVFFILSGVQAPEVDTDFIAKCIKPF